MLSERNDNNSIGHWHSEWLRSGVPTPKDVVCDQSLAHMMGIMKTITQISTLLLYLKMCSLFINKKTNELTNCMLRNGFNHIMHHLSTWFNKETSKRKKTFI